MRLIDADELEKVKFHPLPYTHITPTDVNAEAYKRGWNDAIDAIMSEADTIEERKRGKWIDGKVKHIKNGELRNMRECSECGSSYFVYDNYNSVDEIPNYCPNCGADMRGET